MSPGLSRREWLGTGIAAACCAVGEVRAERASASPFRYCLNTSTIQGWKLDLVELVEIAAKAGYQAVELWIRDLDRYAKGGGSLRDIGKRIEDRGLRVESAIGFAEWLLDDDARRRKGLEQARRDMELVKQIGGTRLAAPPAGATQRPVDLDRAIERYRALLEIGAKIGVVPQLELWGFSRSLSRLGEVTHVAMETGHPQACILADVYHLYKGGSNIGGMRLLNGAALHVLHFNDYPANPPRPSIADAQRIYPGDGIAPLQEILALLRGIGFRGALSLELFNPTYWKQEPLAVAKTGLQRMRAVVEGK